MRLEENIDKDWRDVLQVHLKTQSFKRLSQKINTEYKSVSKTLYPPQKSIFNALNYTALNSVKIVIIGQDPYHNEGQAHGLAFSVPENIKIPPSLRNIFKEIESNVGTKRTAVDLSDWAQQGVLLLNTVLTVEVGKPGSHANIGWEDFTDHIIKTISKSQEHIVFMLWGAYAQSKMLLIDETKHLILTAPHPSPLSAYRGFFGCKHFSKANTYLKEHNKTPIEW